MERYDTRLKVFPGGGLTYSFYDSGVCVGARDSREEPPPWKLLNKPPPDPVRLELLSRKRAMNEVYDLARSNLWDWFITLTLSPQRVDRWDYNQCAAEVMRFTDVLRKAGNQYIIVPEQHEDGAWHFHGLVIGDLKVDPATNFYTGVLLFDSQGRQIYNIKNYKYGVNTATAIEHSAKAASYIAKYMVKKMEIPRGKKRYWASKSLARPSVEYFDTHYVDQQSICADADFIKKIDMKYGKLTICDFRSSLESADVDTIDYHFLKEPFVLEGDSCYDDHENIFVQIDPEFTWKPLAGEQLSLTHVIEQNINCYTE